jgi:hypothetical protein
MPKAGVWVELSDANIRNDHIYLRKILTFFPKDAIGGTSAASASTNPITVEFYRGEKIKTDLAGDKQFLRNRRAVRKFFLSEKAKGGDLVFVTKTGDRQFRFELVKR